MIVGLIVVFGFFMFVKFGCKVCCIGFGWLLIEGEWFLFGLILVIFSVNYGIVVVFVINFDFSVSDNLCFFYGFVNVIFVSFMMGCVIVYLNVERV